MAKRPTDGTNPPSPRSGVTGFLDSHPLSALVGFSASAATIVAGTMTYYTSQRLDAAETRHKAEMLEQAAIDKTALLDATVPLKQTVADLTFRLSSIERRITGAGPTYFDVSSVSAGPETIKALSGKYKAFAGGDFYVAIPEMGNWSYEETTEFEFNSSIFEVVKSSVAALGQLFGNPKLYLWRGGFEIKFQGNDDTALKGTTVTFFPAVTVQKITAEFVKSRVSAMDKLHKMIEQSSEKKADLKTLAESVDQLKKALKPNVDASNPDANINKVADLSNADATSDTGKDVLQAAKRKEELLNNLGSAYSADDASFILTDYLASAMIQGLNFGARHRVYSAQKKANVLYLQDRITFQDVRVYDGANLGEAKQNVVVDEEVFYFGNGAEGFLVKIYLPQLPDRGDAFSWTKSWLTGLQIPLG